MNYIKITSQNIQDIYEMMNDIEYKKERDNQEIHTDKICLVRTQDNFPTGMKLSSPAMANVCIETTLSQLPYGDILEDFKIENIPTPIYKRERDTIHFCINGIVGNHSTGYFTGRDFIIFDKLQNHLNEDIKSIRAEDTYIKGEIELSEDTLVCMSTDKYNTLSQEEQFELTKINTLYIYNPEIFDTLLDDSFTDEENQIEIEKCLVAYILHSNNLPFFTIGAHNFINFDKSLEARTNALLTLIATSIKASQEKHFYSEEKLISDLKEMESIDNTICGHIIYLLSNSVLGIDIKRDFMERLSNLTPQNVSLYSTIASRLIKTIGPDQYIELTNAYNQNYLENIDYKKNKIKEYVFKEN